MSGSELHKAVERIRAHSAYRTLVWGYRLLFSGFALALLSIATVQIRSKQLTLTVIAIGIISIFVGAVSSFVGQLELRRARLWPDYGTNRQRAFVRGVWRDVFRPVHRR